MQLQIFKYESSEERKFKQVRTVEIDGEIWFVASDVAKILGYAKPNNDCLKFIVDPVVELPCCISESCFP